jgi:diadenosine tetraphosphate (Ap4A) HIT family hydrolase
MKYFDINDPIIQAKIIIENELTFAFPTNIPIVQGHTLICPKRPITKMDEITSDELLALFSLQNQLRKALIVAFGAEGFNYAWNE